MNWKVTTVNNQKYIGDISWTDSKERSVKNLTLILKARQTGVQNKNKECL